MGGIEDGCGGLTDLCSACFNGQPMVPQKVPTLYSVATTGNDNTNPLVYGAVNPFIFKMGDIVEVALNNIDAAIHPFHLHGHQFQVIDRPASGAGKWSGRSTSSTGSVPRRDTVSVNANSYVVIRFKVDWPGVYLFHCHVRKALGYAPLNPLAPYSIHE